jgi:peptide/nickel transport system ATP-binding protein
MNTTPTGTQDKAPVLEVEDLTVDFEVRGKSVNILAGLDFTLNAGETLGIIGESGCGKSMTALALLRMVPSPPGDISRGWVRLHGEDLLTVSKRRMNSLRGKEISMIF